MYLHPVEGSKILFPTGPESILVEDKEAEFLEGWRAEQAFTGLHSFVIITFLSDSGGEGLWLLDSGLRYVASTISRVPDALTQNLFDPLCSLINELWNVFIFSQGGQVLSPRLECFFKLPQSCRRQLVDFYLDSSSSLVKHHHCSQPSGSLSRTPVVDCGGRRIPLRVGELQALFDPFLLQREQKDLILSKRLSFPSILSESMLTCSKAFYLGPDLTAYRLFDEVWKTPVLLLAGDIIFRVLAVYLPEANLVLSSDPSGSHCRWPTLMRDFFHHITFYGDSIITYLNADATTPVHFWRGRGAVHLGHLLWNDLAGVEDLVSTIDPVDLPRFMFCDVDAGVEMYGRFESLFPELDGKIVRHTEPFLALVRSFYDENTLLFRSSRIRVNQALRHRVLSLVPERPHDTPVVVLGLRTENRTLADLQGFCEWLVEYFASLMINVTIVVDGHNATASGKLIASNLEERAKRSPVEEERRLVAAMRAAAAGTSVEIVSTIGAALSESLSWCRGAAFFVAPWGAGLAKYRWICNTPGLILTNAWNLENLGDLELYSHARTMDSPTEVIFAPKEAVRDLPDSDLLLKHGEEFQPSICNFEVDLRQCRLLLDRQVAAWMLDALQSRPDYPAMAGPEAIEALG